MASAHRASSRSTTRTRSAPTCARSPSSKRMVASEDYLVRRRHRRRARPGADERRWSSILGARASRTLEHPDRLVFDLDPGAGVDWKDLVAAARDVRARLRRWGSTASRVCPVARACTSCCRSGRGRRGTTPRTSASGSRSRWRSRSPERYVATASKAKREGRHLHRLAAQQRAARRAWRAGRCARARKQAPPCPVAWSELGRTALGRRLSAGSRRCAVRHARDAMSGRDGRRPRGRSCRSRNEKTAGMRSRRFCLLTLGGASLLDGRRLVRSGTRLGRIVRRRRQPATHQQRLDVRLATA